MSINGPPRVTLGGVPDRPCHLPNVTSVGKATKHDAPAVDRSQPRLRGRPRSPFEVTHIPPMATRPGRLGHEKGRPFASCRQLSPRASLPLTTGGDQRR